MKKRTHGATRSPRPAASSSTRAYMSMSSFFPAVQDPAYAISTLTRSAAPAMARPLPGDPGNGRAIAGAAERVRVDIAYAGSCTAGKKEDMDMYARVLEEAAGRGERVAPWVRFYIQCGSQDVKRYCEARGYLELFRKVGATFIEPSCGACINA